MSGRDGNGGGGPPGRRRAVPCRLCDETHWQVFEKHPGSGVWYARTWDNGRVVKKKVGPHGLAVKVAAKWKVEQAEGRFFPKPTKPVPPWDPPFAELMEDYLRRHEGMLIDREGAHRYARYWKEAPETKGKTMRQIARADAEHYRGRRRNEGAPGAKRRRGPGSSSTLNKELRFACAVYYDFLDQLEQMKPEERGSIPPNPFASRRSRRKARLYEPEPPTRSRHLGSQGEDEADRLFNALPDFDAKAKVAAAAFSGVDRGVQFGWEWERDIDFIGQQIRGWRRKGDGTLHVYWVPMNVDLNRTLRAIHDRQRTRWGKPSKWVFPNADNSGPEDGRQFCDRVFKPALIEAGIVRIIETKETKQVAARLWCGPRQVPGFRTVEKICRHIEGSFRWKDLRHTFGSWLRRKGADLDVIGELLGHRKNSPMTTRYAHLTPDMKHAAVQSLAGLVPDFTNEGAESNGDSPDRSLTDPRTDPSPDQPNTTPTVH